MLNRLSKRETEVAHLVAHGLTNAEIAGRMGITRSTVWSTWRRSTSK